MKASDHLWDQNHLYIWPRHNHLYRVCFREINHERWAILDKLKAQIWFDEEHKKEFLKRTWFLLGDEPK